MKSVLQIKVLADGVSGEGSLAGSEMPIFSRSPHMTWGVGALWGAFYQGTHPVHEKSTHMP